MENKEPEIRKKTIANSSLLRLIARWPQFAWHSICRRVENAGLYREDGIALIITIAIIGVLMVVGVGAALKVQGDMSVGGYDNDYQLALHTAEAGVEDYVWHLTKDSEYYLTTTHDAEGNDAQGQPNMVSVGDGQYHLTVTMPGTGDSSITLQSYGIVDGVDRTVTVTVKKKSFLNYMWFTNSETLDGTATPVYWIDGDIVRGPLHTNNNLYIGTNGNPWFQGAVTIGGVEVRQSAGSIASYDEGLTQNAPVLQMPPGNTELRTQAQSGGYYYRGQTFITLLNTGQLRVTNNDPLSTGPEGTIFNPGNGVVYVDSGQTTTGNLFVSGTFKFGLTLATQNDIIVTSDVRRASASSDTTRDMLGLVANNYVTIQNNGNGANRAPCNLTIEAGILALNHSFRLQNHATQYPNRCFGGRSDLGTLTIRGAIVQKNRGAVSTFSGATGVKLSGYAKDYYYDSRFNIKQPPYFLDPVNAGFEVVKFIEN